MKFFTGIKILFDFLDLISYNNYLNAMALFRFALPWHLVSFDQIFKIGREGGSRGIDVTISQLTAPIVPRLFIPRQAANCNKL